MKKQITTKAIPQEKKGIIISQEDQINYLLGNLTDTAIIQEIQKRKIDDPDLIEDLEYYEAYIRHFKITSYEQYLQNLQSDIKDVNKIADQKIDACAKDNTDTVAGANEARIITSGSYAKSTSIKREFTCDTVVRLSDERMNTMLYPPQLKRLLTRYNRAQTDRNSDMEEMIFEEVGPYVLHHSFITTMDIEKSVKILHNVYNEMHDADFLSTSKDLFYQIMLRAKKYGENNYGKSITYDRVRQKGFFNFYKKDAAKNFDFRALNFYPSRLFSEQKEIRVMEVYNDMHPLCRNIVDTIAAKTSQRVRFALAVRYSACINKMSVKTISGWFHYGKRTIKTFSSIADFAIDKYLPEIIQEWARADQYLYPIHEPDKDKGISFPDLVSLAYCQSSVYEESRIVQVLSLSKPKEQLYVYQSFEGILRAKAALRFPDAETHVAGTDTLMRQCMGRKITPSGNGVRNRSNKASQVRDIMGSLF